MQERWESWKDMLKSFTSLLETLTGPEPRQTLAEEEMRIASAALLIHAMAIDGLITEAESAQLREQLIAHFGLTAEEVHRLLIEAERRERDAIDIYRFTSVLRDRLPLERKREIIAMMWRLAFADGRLEALEDNLIWRTAELLAVPARDRMQLKAMIRAELGNE
jgi:uncharacterized tellurite resistance protein B-like protein